MKDETESILSSRDRNDAPNEYNAFKARVDAARAAMGTKYLCHPENRVRKVWGGPVRAEK